MRVVNMLIFKENVSLLSHSGTQYPEEFNKIWSFDWKISIKQRHNSSLNVYRSHKAMHLKPIFALSIFNKAYHAFDQYLALI